MAASEVEAEANQSAPRPQTIMISFPSAAGIERFDAMNLPSSIGTASVSAAVPVASPESHADDVDGTVPPAANVGSASQIGSDCKERPKPRDMIEMFCKRLQDQTVCDYQPSEPPTLLPSRYPIAPSPKSKAKQAAKGKGKAKAAGKSTPKGVTKVEPKPQHSTKSDAKKPLSRFSRGRQQASHPTWPKHRIIFAGSVLRKRGSHPSVKRFTSLCESVPIPR